MEFSKSSVSLGDGVYIPPKTPISVGNSLNFEKQTRPWPRAIYKVVCHMSGQTLSLA